MTTTDIAPSLHELAAAALQEDLDREREQRLAKKIEELRVQAARDAEIAAEQEARAADEKALANLSRKIKNAHEKTQTAIDALLAENEVLRGLYDDRTAVQGRLGHPHTRYRGGAVEDVIAFQLAPVLPSGERPFPVGNRRNMRLPELDA